MPTTGVDRRHLKGEEDDALHTVLRTAGHNIRHLLRVIRKKRHMLSLRLIWETSSSGQS